MEAQLFREALTGRSRSALRIGLQISTVLVLAVFAANVPTYFFELGAVCEEPGCNPDQLTPEGARALWGLGVSVSEYATYFGGLTVVSAFVWFGVAALIGWRRHEDPFALFVALTLVLVGAFPVTGSVSMESSFLPFPTRVVNGMELVCFALFLCLFPDGRFVPRWTARVALGAATLGAASVIFPENPLGPLWFVLMAALISAQVHRYRRVSDPAQRRQTKWVVFAVAVVVLAVLGTFLATEFFSSEGASILLAPIASVALVLIPLSIGASILKHRLFDIDFIINRALVYATLTACVVGVYILVVGYLGALFRVEDSLLASLVATGIVAVLFAPLRERLQKTVNGLMYGERDDPYSVISRLGERIEATLAPDEALPTIAKTVREALKLPYAAISLREKNDLFIVAEDGERRGNETPLPLTHHGEEIGVMTLAPRPGEDGFTAADTRLLEDLARQAGATAHAVRLTKDLRRSRERLVTTREEERRRLRRDLHDGLGPTLGSLPMKLDVASDMISSDPEAAKELLASLKKHARIATSDVRRLVHELRPPALDELGLEGAIREAAARHNELHIEVAIPKNIPPLPAAVEVAAYRIAVEATTNAARHSGASRCEVRISIGEDTLEIEVSDDGRGIGEKKTPGVGLHSMRERAEELGGAFGISSSESGTTVRASLPLGGSGL